MTEPIGCGDCWRAQHLTAEQRADPANQPTGSVRRCSRHQAIEDRLLAGIQFVPRSSAPPRFPPAQAERAERRPSQANRYDNPIDRACAALHAAGRGDLAAELDQWATVVAAAAGAQARMWRPVTVVNAADDWSRAMASLRLQERARAMAAQKYAAPDPAAIVRITGVL